ncbi:MAG: VWA domain-containing protein [Edaphobacter sp.]|uniref:VWA domain-containing protein n=1 Tax=Edaphobacter sp. TaxID=1934404 RepID=UPI00238F225B|nr:VWA domain-containing protein [Edaphobacter sp.]MDE1175615.1 VWA domain-containing protein [Edaphobacter sp.]
MKTSLWSLLLVSCLLLYGGAKTSAQDDSRITVNVVLVQLNVAVTDRKGNYVTGLKPEDFVVTEDKIPEKIATFEEGNEPTTRLVIGPDGRMVSQSTVEETTSTAGTAVVKPAASGVIGANVFILFDTSNYMYRGFVFAQDSIADFIRSLEGAGRVAFYSYSRDLSRAVQLTADRPTVLRGVRSTVAGDDAALYNSLLLTVKDAARLTGRKAIVVFSNGPDNASLVPPEDVAELAQSTGTIIYMISTRDAQAEPISTAVFERMSKATGGKAYFSKSWKDEKDAFASIREDLAHLYSLSYYPQANANRGWRTISVKLVGEAAQKYRIRTRDGYRVLKQAQFVAAQPPSASASESEAIPQP